tara:strand:- start:754 stop:1482 length:729 start_codon:yes stop_codon:yes gene_type:complete
MKNITITVLTVLLSISATAQERYADLRVSFITPQENDVVYAKTTLHYSLNVVNQGPDSLWPKDSIRYRMTQSGIGGQSFASGDLGKIVAPGDSFMVYDSIYIDYPYDSEKFQIRFSYAFVMWSKAYGDRDLDPEFYVDKDDNHPTLWLTIKGTRVSVNEDKLGEEIVVYPNPSATGKVTIKNIPRGATEIKMSNAMGQFVDLEVMDSLQGEESVIFNSVSKGLYFITFRSEGKFYTKKIIAL